MANTVEVIFQGVDQISNNTAKMNRSLQTMNRVALRLGGALAAAFSVREMGRAIDTFTLVENRIRLVTDSVDELNAVQEELFRLAQNTRSAFLPTVELYSRLARSTEQLGLSQQQVIDLTETISQAIQISGATAEEASAGVIQFAQGLASGALRGDELRSVLEQMPRLARALADGLGKNIGELRELGEAGELTVSRIVGALQDEAPKLDSEFDKVSATIGNSFQQVQNSLGRFVAEAGDATGVTDALSGSMEGLAGAIDSVGDALFPTQLQALQHELSVVQSSIESIVRLAGDQESFLFSLEGDQKKLAALRLEFFELVKQIDALRDSQRDIGDIPLIQVESAAANLAKLDEALEKFHAKERKRAIGLAQNFISQFETVEQQITRQLAEFDLAKAFIPDDLHQQIVDGIKAARLEGLEAIVVEDIVDVEGMQRKLDEVLDSTTEWGKRMESIADEAARSMQRAFSDFLFDPFQDGLDGMVKGFLDAIRRMVADEAALRFFKLLFGKGDEGGLLERIFGGGGDTPAPFPGGPPLAHGGFTIPGRLHPVNEREPEFLLTRGRSEVIPLSKMAGKGRGGVNFAPHTELNLLSQPITREQLENLLDNRDAKLFADFKRTLRDDGID